MASHHKGMTMTSSLQIQGSPHNKGRPRHPPPLQRGFVTSEVLTTWSVTDSPGKEDLEPKTAREST
ncbi:hypothetical protein CCACVL1_29843 [Corchorus capsularis]|uniref:Uncharacterized protein n=1 Tax=Corchorus capsularis TaxID=210143 RepID=A0A1R3FZT0_COCAP|nr:hypothetical protein CCACVL1_29843 [Corchorus capsularis]